MTWPEFFLVMGAYVAFLAVLLLGYWVYGSISDRLHARRLLRAFDMQVALLERNLRRETSADRSM